jgi:Ca-activated chloride channel family protein
MKRIAALLVLLVFACTTAQKPPSTASRSDIEGVVVMPDGSPLPGVTVTLSAKGQPERTVVTDANGHYAIRGVSAGTYQMLVALAGFNSVRRTLTVGAGKNPLVETTLGWSSVTEAITVTAEAPRVVPTHSAISQSITVSGVSLMDDSVADPQYAAIRENDFIDAKKERTTTFAIDVDRASYANVRRFLTSGYVPPPDAVRIEEMINYFSYSYPQPAENVPFSITTEVAGCPWNAKARLLRIGIQGRNLEQWKMAPNNLVFLLDVSGSMQGPDRLGLVKNAFDVLVQELRAEDRVSIVVYAGAAGLVLPPTSGADKERIRDAIAALEAGGSTAGGEGIELAYKIAQENFLDNGNNRVILATDGDFNVGVSSIEKLEKLIEKKRRSGIFLSVLGVGDDNYQDARMEMLADKGNGNYAYLDSLQEAEKVFRKELTGTLVTIAKDVKVQLEFDPSAVASYRQIGYENRALANEDFEDDEKDAGDLGAGHSVTALFELIPAAPAKGPIATLRLRYKEPKGWTSKPLVAEIADDGKSAYEASPDMQFAAAVAELGMLLRDSPHKGTATWDDVLQLANISRGVDLDGTRQEFIQIAERARDLR